MTSYIIHTGFSGKIVYFYLFIKTTVPFYKLISLFKYFLRLKEPGLTNKRVIMSHEIKKKKEPFH